MVIDINSHSVSTIAPPSDETKEILAYDISLIESVRDSLAEQKAQAENATSLLFNALSQIDSLISQQYSKLAHEQGHLARQDNQLNIQIAKSTKADSIAMKTFTFLTALFLPRTFIGTMLAIPMIDWIPDSANKNS